METNTMGDATPSPEHQIYPAPPPDPRRSHVSRNANRLANFFNVLAILIAILGGIGAVVVLFAGASAGLASFLAVALYTLLMWASMMLASVVAGYIGIRVDEVRA